MKNRCSVFSKNENLKKAAEGKIFYILVISFENILIWWVDDTNFFLQKIAEQIKIFDLVEVLTYVLLNDS